MAQTGRSNVRYVDPQRRYTVVLSPSWNAPFGALPHDDRAGTHDSADGRCGSYASIGRGQASTKIFRRYPQGALCSPLKIRHERRGCDGASRAGPNSEVPFWSALGAPLQCGILAGLRTGMGQDRLSEECPRRVRFTSTNRHQSPRLSRPVSARSGHCRHSPNGLYGTSLPPPNVIPA
jgi:hypothetical protein